MYNILFFVVFSLVTSQYYNIESDTMYTMQNMMSDIPYSDIHSANTALKSQAFYDTLKGSSHSFNVLECRNYKDFYYLLYSMCQRSILCSEMYYIDSTTAAHTADKVNFKKFVYQLSLSQLFIVRRPTNNDTSSSSNSVSQLFLLEDNTPMEWIPRYIIQLDDSPINQPCHTAFNLTSQENIPFVHSTLYLLHAYKYYVVNDYKCNHYSKWLILDATNKPKCVDKHGKDSDSEVNFRIAMLIIAIIIFMMIVLRIITFFVSVPKLMQKIDETNRIRFAKIVK